MGLLGQLLELRRLLCDQLDQLRERAFEPRDASFLLLSVCVCVLAGHRELKIMLRGRCRSRATARNMRV
ncbi:MAG: hypothetical protein RL701_2880 [Pseudomonadota bacterium]|jgi:hypothetical protein